MTGTKATVKELEAQLQEASARVEALEAEVKEWCEVVEKEQLAHRHTKRIEVYQKGRADALFDARQVMERFFNEEGHSHIHTKASAWDWQQRAERAEGHLRVIGSFGAQLWEACPGDGSLVGSWRPSCLWGKVNEVDLFVQRVLAEQQAEHECGAGRGVCEKCYEPEEATDGPQ